MKHAWRMVRTIVAVTLIATACDAAAGGDGPEWKKFGEAISEAGSANKMVVVDVYTDWCGWCKRMDAEVYGDSTVQAALREHFIAVKLDAESSTKHTVQGREASEREIAKSFGVSGYPTTVFLSPKGELITVLPGYIDKQTFVHVLEYIQSGSYRTTRWNDFLQSRKG